MNRLQILERTLAIRQLRSMTPQFQDSVRTSLLCHGKFLRWGALGVIHEFGDIMCHPAAKRVR